MIKNDRGWRVDACPRCGSLCIYRRKYKQPMYRCKHCEAEFDHPIKDTSEVFLKKLKKERKFLIKSYRMLEILLRIFDGFHHVYDMLHILPISRFCLYSLLKRYRTQGLIRAEREKMFVRLESHFEITKEGLRRMLYALQEECELREEQGLDVEKIKNLIYRIEKRIA